MAVQYKCKIGQISSIPRYLPFLSDTYREQIFNFLGLTANIFIGVNETSTTTNRNDKNALAKSFRGRKRGNWKYPVSLKTSVDSYNWKGF